MDTQSACENEIPRSGKKKEHKLKLLGLDSFQWGGELKHVAPEEIPISLFHQIIRCFGPGSSKEKYCFKYRVASNCAQTGVIGEEVGPSDILLSVQLSSASGTSIPRENSHLWGYWAVV